MAGFVTANRWATGVETHQTSEGRILCTGVGCVGCFPEVFSKEANELGVCDVDLSGSILGLRPFLDEENSRENFKLNGKLFSRRKKRAKPKIRGHKRTIDKERVSFEKDQKVFETINKEKYEVASRSEMREMSSTVATQTEPSEMGIDSQSMLSKPLNNVSKQDLQTLDGGNRSDTVENPSDNHTQIGANCNIVRVDDNVNKTHRNPVGLFTQPSASRFEKIHDKMYIVSSKNIALSSCDNSVPQKNDFTEQAKDGVTITEQQLTTGEDAVCFFFALEYYNSQRILPDFRVMEIVEALSKVVELKDIKCVQRISRRWHMVLKSRKYIRLLRNSGLKLRGRVYQLVDDVDGYFDVVQ
ncbi:uncharacterized protein LOC144643333 [Oculina patagonica]